MPYSLKKWQILKKCHIFTMPDIKRAQRNGLSARRVRRTKSRVLNGRVFQKIQNISGGVTITGNYYAFPKEKVPKKGKNQFDLQTI